MKRSRSFFTRTLSVMMALTIVLSLCVFHVSAAEKVTVKTGTYYTIKNVGTGKYLNIYGNQNKNNANVDIYAKDNTSGQDFKFALVNGSYTITPRCATGRRLNVYGDSAYNKANVCLWSATKHSTQGWIIQKVSSGYIIRSANNQNYVLTATGSKNSSNVNIQKYNSSNKNQVWTCGAFSTTSTPNKTNNTTNTTNTTNTANTTKVSASTIKTQIKNTYTKAKELYKGYCGEEKFVGYCGDYVRMQLQALGIISKGRSWVVDTDCRGAGKEWYSSVKTGKTSTGYTKTKFAGGANCLANLVKQKGNNIQNIVISYPRAWGCTNSKPGAGHVVFIHAIIDGTVYYSECYTSGRIVEGAVLTYSVAQFDKAFTSSYGNANGAIWFHK